MVPQELARQDSQADLVYNAAYHQWKLQIYLRVTLLVNHHIYGARPVCSYSGVHLEM